MTNAFETIIGNGYENMGFRSYTDGLDDLENGVWYDELENSDVEGVLKANYYVNGRLRQIYSGKGCHAVVVAGTGLGKTTQFVIPTIKSYARQKTKKSLVISDPKGEVRRACEKDLVEGGYRVLRLDFRNIMQSECWNPLTPIYRKYQRAFNLKSEVELVDTPQGPRNRFVGRIYTNQQKLNHDIERMKKVVLEEVGCDIDAIATVICKPTGASNDKLWEEGAKDVLKAFLWAMLEDSREETRHSRVRITEDTYSLATVLSIASTFVGDRDMGDYDKGYFSRRRQNMKSYSFAANTIIGPASNTRASFMAVFNTELAAFKSADRITSCNSFDFEELMDGPVAIFVNYRDEVKTNYTLISLFVQSLYIFLIGEANKTKTGKLDRAWYFVLDEFGNFPKQNDFDVVISACRGRNIFFELIIQSYAQLEGVYDKYTAQIIKDNLNLHIFIGSNNPETLEEFSRECGYTTRVTIESALNGDKDQMDRFDVDTEKLVPISRLAHLEEGECVVTEANTGYVLWSKLERFYKLKEMCEVSEESAPYEVKVDVFDDRYFYDCSKLGSYMPR